MKHLVTLLFLTSTFLLKSQIVLNDLQGHYQFNATEIIDESPNNISGTSQNIESAIGLEQMSNTAYDFNGFSSYISLGIENRNITDVVTLSAWIKTTSNENQVVCSKYDWIEDKGYFLRMIDGKVSFGGRNNGNEFSEAVGFDNINDGQWHHVLGIVQQNEWQIYVDCQGQGTFISSANTPDLTNSVPFMVGRLSIPTGSGELRFFEGTVDDVRIYNRRLDQLEIDSLCMQNFTTSTNDIQVPSAIIEVYSNPVKETIDWNWVDTDEFNKDGFQYKIYNLNGALLKSGRLERQISCTHLAKGIYLFVVFNDKTGISETIRIIKI